MQLVDFGQLHLCFYSGGLSLHQKLWRLDAVPWHGQEPNGITPVV